MGKIKDSKGILSLNTEYIIPQNGLEIIYEAPEFSGKVKLEYFVKDEDDKEVYSLDTLFSVRIKNRLQPLNIDGLQFVNLDSHPDGKFGASDFNDKLTMFVQLYEKYSAMKGVPSENTLEITSEGACLPWGGAFDILRMWGNYNRDSGHKRHRNGATIDISMKEIRKSSYSKILQEAMQKAIKESGLGFPVAIEGPDGLKHWHIEVGSNN